ncbi:hypothetical protein [Actinomadura viridis]|uniref:Uncharacterized protein n=1 Tax=Actinomadura viridis TaxID=58110 RepID=A0A931GKB2_9ACTN|nr:hypothetical protein [Actinomadura viridis]MBG6086211.1 hypothetical protein [Actinomadura viridis]
MTTLGTGGGAAIGPAATTGVGIRAGPGAAVRPESYDFLTGR